MENTVRVNTYFKGGPADCFMSGLWIGNVVQENVVFVMCSFNDVQAEFKDCTFIDCDGVSPKMLQNGGREITLPQSKRLTLEVLENGTWRDGK